MRRSFFWLCFRRATGWERACEERAPQCSRGFSVSVVCRPSLPPSLWLSSGLSHSTLPPLPPSLPSLSVLEILEFTSARKRMSVIVESVEDGQILVLAKGADTAMGPRLSPGQVCLSSPSLPPSLPPFIMSLFFSPISFPYLPPSLSPGRTSGDYPRSHEAICFRGPADVDDLLCYPEQGGLWEVRREGGREGGRAVFAPLCEHIYSPLPSLPPSLPLSLPRWYLEFERAAKDLTQIELRKSGKVGPLPPSLPSSPPPRSAPAPSLPPSLPQDNQIDAMMDKSKERLTFPSLPPSLPPLLPFRTIKST